MALFVYPFKIILQKFKSVHHRFILMISVNILQKFLFVIFGNAGVEDGDNCSFFRVLSSIDFKIKYVLFELEMHLHLFFK